MAFGTRLVVFVTQQIDPDGNTSTYAYDSLGDQTQSVLGVGTPQAATNSAYYDGDGNLTLSVNADHDSTSYFYDADGNNTLVIAALGTAAANTTSMAYDVDGDETLMVEGLNSNLPSTTSYAYDAAGNQTLQITAYGTSNADTITSSYDPDGNLTQQIDSDPSTSDFFYDVLGNQTLSELGVGTPQQANDTNYYDGDGNLTLSIDPDGNSTEYYYDADGDNTLMVEGAGTGAASSTSMAYDADGDETLLVEGYNSPAAESTFYAYDANGNQTQTITGYNSGKQETTLSRYDGDGNLTQQIDPDGNTSDFAYDSLGDQTLSVQGVGTGVVASSYNYYDGDDNLTLSVDADGDSTSYQYDADGNNTLMIEGVNSSSVSSTSLAYDADGDNILVIEGYGTSAASTTSMAYDAAGNQTLTITGFGTSHAETTTSAYDADGDLTQQIDPDGDTSDFAYDALGDQTLSIVGAGSGNPGTTTDSYDADGNLTLTVNPVGDSTSYQYDPDGNQTLEIDGFGSSSVATIHYLYDSAGNQTQEIDPDGNTTSWQYDADGDQTLMIQAYGSSSATTTTYEYDNDGNQTLQINPNGTSIASAYDADGNLSSETWYNANGSVANSSNYTYDGDGNILTAGNDAGTYTFSYNAAGEQTQVVNPNGVTLNYQYDADGNATQITDSLGDTVTSQYDADGDLIARGYSGPDSAQMSVQLGYDGDGNLTSINRYSGTQLVGTSSYAYDAQGNVTSITHDNASDTTLDSFSYSYDAADELTQEVDNGTTTAYSYDANQQLTSAGSTNYAYDSNGNPDDSGDTIGPNNELLSDGTWNYSYDANGNMIDRTGVAGGPDAGLTWTYAYDPGNELISATETNSQSQTLVQENFTYDVFGDILATSLSTDGGSPVTTYYVYNGSTLWTTTNASNVPEDFYLSGDEADQYFAQYDATNGAAWYLTDNLGSVRTTMDNSGNAIDNIVYDAYGNDTSQSDPSQQPDVGFCGYQTFAAIDVNVSGDRVYLPQSQQWMQEDSELLEPGPNPREYVNDEPTNATDPTGTEAKPVSTLDQLNRQIVRQKLIAQSWPGVAPAADVRSLEEQRTKLLQIQQEMFAKSYKLQRYGSEPRSLGGQGGSPMSMYDGRGGFVGTASKNNGLQQFLMPGGGLGLGLAGNALSSGGKSEQEYMKAMQSYSAKALPIYQRASQDYLKQVLAKPPAELRQALLQPLPVKSFAEAVLKELGQPPISSTKEQALQDVAIAVQAEGMRQMQRKAAAALERERQLARLNASMAKQEIIPEPGTTLYDDMIRQRMEQRRQMMRRAGVSEWYIWGEFFLPGGLPGGSFNQMMETLAPLAAAVETRNSIRATVEGGRPLPPVAAEVRPLAGGVSVAGAMGVRGGFRPGSPSSVPTTGEALLGMMASSAASPKQTRKIADLIAQTQAMMDAAKARMSAAAAIDAQMNRNAPKNVPEGAQPQTVFRGERSSRTPVKVFEEGIPAKGTNADLEAHVAANLKDSNFVATSIRPAIAKGFAGKNGYVYVIRTKNGIDVNATLGAKSPFPEQFEVAIPGGVANSEVMGAFPMKNGEIAGPFVPNPNYKPPK